VKDTHPGTGEKPPGHVDDPLVETLASPSGARPSSTSGALSFSVGEFVAGRYRVVRSLGIGGMGEVYECEDRMLGEPVALKTIRPEIASDPAALSRFRREIQLARRVTHGNVCRIFDVGSHKKDLGNGELELAFLTMELLPGQTLAERLRDAAPLAQAEVLAITSQVSAALAAAHDAGVVHRDFKPGNVMLVPGENGARAVVTDFGLARARVPDPKNNDTVTGAGGVVGSPAYMAPEQVEGGEVGPAADQFALGVVVYQMLTGVLPFVGDSPLATAAKRLKSLPAPPSTHVATISPVWEAAVLRALAREPGDRFERVTDLAAAMRDAAPAGSEGAKRQVRSLSEQRPAVPMTTPPSRGRDALRVVALAGAFVLGSLGAGAGFAWWSSRGAAPPPEPPVTVGQAVPASLPVLGAVDLERIMKLGQDLGHAIVKPCDGPSLAVMGFRNVSGSGETAWISTALGEMLTTELGMSDGLRTVPGESVARLKRELSLADSESYAEDTLLGIRENLCATHVLVGAYTTRGDGEKNPLRLDLRVQDTATGQTIAQVSATGQQGDLIDLVGRAGERLRSAIGVSATTTEAAAIATLPRPPGAARSYTLGLAAMRREECHSATIHLEKAVAGEPSFAPAHAQLAMALYCVGWEERALAEAAQAQALAGRLPERERLQVEANTASLRGDSEGAFHAVEALWEKGPRDVNLGLDLARAQLQLGKKKEATATLAELRKLPPPENQHPHIDVFEAEVALKDGDRAKGVALLERSARRADARGTRLMAASARMKLAAIYMDEGETERARATAEEVLAVGREFGDRELEVVGLDLLCGLTAQAGLISDAEKMCQQAVSVAEQVSLMRRLPDARARLAWVEASRGRLPVAEKLLRTSTEEMVDKKSKSKWKMGGKAGLELAKLRVLRGDLSGAESAIDAAEAAWSTTAPFTWDESAMPLLALGVLERARGTPDEALTMLDRAAAIADSRGARGLRLDIDLERARTLIDAGRGEEAIPLAQRVAAELAARGFPDAEAEARAVHALALLASGRVVEARTALAPALAWLGKSENSLLRTMVELADGRIAAAGGLGEHRAGAGKKLASVAGEARRMGAGLIELEAGVALAELEGAAGGSPAARLRASRVEKTARARGLGGLARRAALVVGG
jgi:tetratricopeptide (TPR) repeat protein/TolB-like protein